jgi:8-oxo-dGTP pyrophosphatase MutT (NUDIX family)
MERVKVSSVVLFHQGYDGEYYLMFVKQNIYSETNKRYEKFLGLPGGKCDKKDLNPFQTLKREFREEVGDDLPYNRYKKFNKNILKTNSRILNISIFYGFFGKHQKNINYGLKYKILNNETYDIKFISLNMIKNLIDISFNKQKRPYFKDKDNYLKFRSGTLETINEIVKKEGL